MFTKFLHRLPYPPWGDQFGRVICAWCGRDLGPYSGDGDTHTICGDCLKKMNI